LLKKKARPGSVPGAPPRMIRRHRRASEATAAIANRRNAQEVPCLPHLGRLQLYAPKSRDAAHKHTHVSAGGACR
jgi:hypothetical protein